MALSVSGVDWMNEAAELSQPYTKREFDYAFWMAVQVIEMDHDLAMFFNRERPRGEQEEPRITDTERLCLTLTGKTAGRSRAQQKGEIEKTDWAAMQDGEMDTLIRREDSAGFRANMESRIRRVDGILQLQADYAKRIGGLDEPATAADLEGDQDYIALINHLGEGIQNYCVNEDDLLSLREPLKGRPLPKQKPALQEQSMAKKYATRDVANAKSNER